MGLQSKGLANPFGSTPYRIYKKDGKLSWGGWVIFELQMNTAYAFSRGGGEEIENTLVVFLPSFVRS